MASPLRLTFRPLTLETWPDVEALFGPRGACGGCWCMAYRLRHADYVAGKGIRNKRRLKRLAASGRPPGVLAYHGNRPVGWCAIAPRVDYQALARSRVLAPVDDEPVWSITCFFIDKAYRRRGVSAALATAATRLARRLGARIVEAYPVDPGKRLPDAFAWTGLPSTLRDAGFVEVARRSRARPIMRRRLRG